MTTLRDLPKPEVVFILGSGYSWFTQYLLNPQTIDYQDLPGMRPSTTPGHSGHLVSGMFEGRNVWVFSGRAHLYEGATWQQIIRPVELAAEFGANQLLVTNAAGGIRPEMNVGDVMLIEDVLWMTAPFRMGWAHSLVPASQRPHSQPPSSLRPTNSFKPHPSESLEKAVERTSYLHSGTYVYVTGPSYETPAEIRAFQSMGADAVGMSTVPELLTATSLGLPWRAVSLITNQASGLGDEPLDHTDIVDVANVSQPRLLDLFKMMVT
jgi:purine-nucleoside phosphorylase